MRIRLDPNIQYPYITKLYLLRLIYLIGENTVIHIVVGTRAQFLKMAPVMVSLEKRKMQWRWIYTAQHKDTMDMLIKGFKIKPPDRTLFDWHTEAKTIKKMAFWLGKIMTCLILERKKILGEYLGPTHVVLTHGDTITAWWGALLGKLSRCKVMHVESGLRSFNLLEPFPEEINRLLTFCLTDIYACPGTWAVDNLKTFKGVKLNTIHNTQLETLFYGLDHAEESTLILPQDKYAVVTLHRYENIFKPDRLIKIITLIEKISEKIPLYFILHPSTTSKLDENGMGERLFENPNITSIPRLDHLSFIKLINAAEFVITDGGGNQEELFHLGKPCLLFRSYTERLEGLSRNTVLSKFDNTLINDFVDNYEKYRTLPTVMDKKPSDVILDYLEKEGFSNSRRTAQSGVVQSIRGRTKLTD